MSSVGVLWKGSVCVGKVVCFGILDVVIFVYMWAAVSRWGSCDGLACVACGLLGSLGMVGLWFITLRGLYLRVEASVC